MVRLRRVEGRLSTRPSEIGRVGIDREDFRADAAWLAWRKIEPDEIGLRVLPTGEFPMVFVAPARRDDQAPGKRGWNRSAHMQIERALFSDEFHGRYSVTVLGVFRLHARSSDSVLRCDPGESTDVELAALKMHLAFAYQWQVGEKRPFCRALAGARHGTCLPRDRRRLAYPSTRPPSMGMRR